MSRKVPSSVDKFHSRVTRPGLSERDHRAAREREYGGIGDRFPNSIAKRGHDDYKNKQYVEQDSRNTYLRDKRRSRGYVDRFDDPEEREYYNDNSAGITPRDHQDLAPKAGRWEESARNHASAREDPYKRVPYMYPSATAQKEHYLDDGYGRVDDARSRREMHERYASNDDDPCRDKYGRSVPYGQGFR